MSEALPESVSAVLEVRALHAGQLILTLPDRRACARCAAGQGCGAGVFARLLQAPARELRLPVTPAQIRQLQGARHVELRLANSSLIHGSLILYALPIFCAGTAVVLAHLAGAGDVLAVFALLAGGLPALLAARVYSRRMLRAALTLVPVGAGDNQPADRAACR